ncbi:DUF5818 domain-containing protein [Tardiphaga sp.]|uniref:DUF5818 domain-containing protein n=1 Tax=Tardiphaga sp. TaxID=1926292 RepID=UPI003529EB9A
MTEQFLNAHWVALARQASTRPAGTISLFEPGPLGRIATETSLLLRERKWPVLQRDDGGRWRLNTTARADRLLGPRVYVGGKRRDFDILDVERIERISGS